MDSQLHWFLLVWVVRQLRQARMHAAGDIVELLRLASYFARQ